MLWMSQRNLEKSLHDLLVRKSLLKLYIKLVDCAFLLKCWENPDKILKTLQNLSKPWEMLLKPAKV